MASSLTLSRSDWAWLGPIPGFGLPSSMITLSSVRRDWNGSRSGSV